ncbi:MAG: hypothetical protein WA777_17610 [Rhodanobacter sp.]
MWRDPAWMQRGLDAMRATLDVEPQLKQAMIDFLLEEGFWNVRSLSQQAAHTRFNACMNPGKAEFFKFSELWALMKRFQRYELWLAMGDDFGFERPRLVPTEARRQELIEKMLAAQERLSNELATLRAELSRLDDGSAAAGAPSDSQGAALRIHPAMREDGPRFSQANF